MAAANFAEVFEKVLVPAIFRPWARDLLDRVPVSSTDRVLDVGCGTGIVARLVRERIGRETRIEGVDLSPQMIAVARALAPDIVWHEAGAEAMPLADGVFDVALCQQAFQFFPDRPAALREMRRVLAEGGRVAITTWRPLEENPLFAALDDAATRQFGPRPDRRFQFGDERAISLLLAEAGFKDIDARVVLRTEHVPDARTFVRLNLAATLPALNEMGDAEREEAVDRMVRDAASTLARFAEGPGLAHPVKANVVTAVS